MRFTESRRGQGFAKPRLVLSRRREQARGLHANERSTRTSFCRKESTSFWHARIAARFGGRTRPRDSIRILQVFMNSQMEALFGLKGRRTAVLGLAYAPWQKLSSIGCSGRRNTANLYSWPVQLLLAAISCLSISSLYVFLEGGGTAERPCEVQKFSAQEFLSNNSPQGCTTVRA